jgi:catechol 2,3-dioxygenase-like lactoylglutathione lyase family enzyme
MEFAEIARFTEDVESTAAFYESLPDAETVASGDGIQIMTIGGATVLVHETYDPEGGEVPPEDHVTFEVDDLDASVAELEDEGLDIAMEPREYEWGRSAYLRDPDGRLVELAEA